MLYPRNGQRDGFNPRSPRGGATQTMSNGIKLSGFQSTLPAWGSDQRGRSRARTTGRFQSTLPAWGSDRTHSSLPRYSTSFQSTLPAWGSDQPDCAAMHSDVVSIHAPRVGERHARFFCWPHLQSCFNPRSPRGGATHRWARCGGGITRFNPPPPPGGATTRHPGPQAGRGVSIHAPRVGERPTWGYGDPAQAAFQSTLPAWGSD